MSETLADKARNPLNPAILLLNAKQVTSIQDDLTEVRDNYPEGTELARSDIETLSNLQLSIHYHEASRPTRGVDVDWSYVCNDLLIRGSCDIYGHGLSPVVQTLGETTSSDGIPVDPDDL